MLKGKKGPYILLFILVITLFFILGLQYGKMVEKADKTINYILSITPTQKLTPTPQLNLTYTSFELAPCNISILYPSNMYIENQGNAKAKIISNNKLQFIEIICPEGQLPTPTVTGKPITLDNNAATQYEVTKTSIKAIEYRVRNPITNRLVIITTDKDTAPLLIKSLEFTN